MGFSIRWIAIRDEKLSEINSVLGFEKIVEVETFPESDISGTDLSNGWCHIQFNEFDNPFIKENSLKLISKNTTVIVCQVEEHVMHSKTC